MPLASFDRKVVSRAGGFSLLELIVAITIVAMALTVVPFAISKLYDSMQYRNAVREILAGLRATRVQAMQTGKPFAFVVHPGDRTVGLEGRPAEHLEGSFKLSLIVADTEISDEAGRIRFYADGSSTGGVVILERSNGNGVRLRVDWLLGRVFQEELAR